MKQAVPLLLVALVLSGCAGQHEAQMERGWVDRAVLEGREHHEFKARYDTVQVEQRFVQMIRNVYAGVSTLVFLGTWCSDSQREVPRFLKAADEAGIPPESIKLYALDRTKKSDDGLTEQYRIERVPTFIFLKNGEEIGRIIEVPQVNVEADMVMILAKAK
ncbi:MAG: thiol reductase thioredoxin [Bacteroidetes bacterium]|nr:thiol reductase thioredoxin [Bacteroidota bacterium]